MEEWRKVRTRELSWDLCGDAESGARLRVTPRATNGIALLANFGSFGWKGNWALVFQLLFFDSTEQL